MDFLRRLLQGFSDMSHPLSSQPLYNYNPTSFSNGELPAPVYPKVLTIFHNPTIGPRGGQKAQVAYGWNHPDALAEGYIADLKYATYGYLNYQIVDRIEVDAFPIKRDGFRYTDETYEEAWRTRKFHDPDGVDYLELVHEFNMIERVNSGEIDEIWLFGHPYGGYYESIMGGPGAFWCNAPALKGTEHAKKRFVIMGFNFERSVGEMLEDMGHRLESMMLKVYEPFKGTEKDLFAKMWRIEKTHPGQAECGNVHFAPNSTRDYEWGNPTPVLSRADTWYKFPDLSGEPRVMTCADWGNGDIRQHHVWLFRHMPHIVGETDGVLNNWWEYVVNPDLVRNEGPESWLT